jgi:hypothetical protein
MDSFFSVPYSEHQTIESVLQILPKSEGFGVFIPVSRQQAGVDFIIMRGKKIRRAQVKSSRHYEWDTSPTLRFWYQNFKKAYSPGHADLFFLFAVYPAFEVGKKVSDPKAHWRNLILVFTDKEMRRVLESPDGDSFFQFGIDPSTSGDIPSVKGTRGGLKGRSLKSHVIEFRSSWLKRQFR